MTPCGKGQDFYLDNALKAGHSTGRKLVILVHCYEEFSGNLPLV